jgi:uncharacterized protein
MIIDFHTHIFPPEVCQDRERFFQGEPAFRLLYQKAGKSPLSTGEQLLDYLDRHHIDRAVTFGFPWQQSNLIRRSNDYVLETMNRHPGRITGFACINPMSAGALEEAQRCLKEGLKGLGEIALYDPAVNADRMEGLKPLAQLAAQNNVPLLLHTNEPVGHYYPGKVRLPFWDLYDLIQSHPQTRFILAHWGGGLWWYLLMKREVKAVLANTYVDTAASPFLYRPEIYRYAVEIMGLEKILFGSDFPLLPLDRYQKEMDQAGLYPEEQGAILGQNAQKLLNQPSP